MNRFAACLLKLALSVCLLGFCPLAVSQIPLVTYGCTPSTTCQLTATSTRSSTLTLNVTGTCDAEFASNQIGVSNTASVSCLFHSYDLTVVGNGGNEYSVPGGGCPVNPQAYAIGWVAAYASVYLNGVSEATSTVGERCTGFYFGGSPGAVVDGMTC